MRKARVLPVPVLAWARTSWRARIVGRVAAWTWLLQTSVSIATGCTHIGTVFEWQCAEQLLTQPWKVTETRTILKRGSSTTEHRCRILRTDSWFSRARHHASGWSIHGSPAVRTESPPASRSTTLTASSSGMDGHVGEGALKGVTAQ